MTNPAALRFLHQFRPGSHVFDVGVNGRQIIHVGELIMLTTEHRWPRRLVTVRHRVAMALCNDVVLVCLVKGPSETVCELVLPPIDRRLLSVDGLPVGVASTHAFSIANPGESAVIFETPSAAEKAAWVHMLRDRASVVVTANLRGPRLVPISCNARDDIIAWLDVPDPFSQDGQTALEKEWQGIPAVGGILVPS